MSLTREHQQLHQIKNKHAENYTFEKLHNFKYLGFQVNNEIDQITITKI